MTNSAAERPVLTAEQRLELNYLKLTWDRFYEISYDGAAGQPSRRAPRTSSTRTARPR